MIKQKHVLHILINFFCCPTVRANEMRQLEAAQEREELRQTIADNTRLDMEEAAKNMQERLRYQQDLIDQMAYNHTIREGERALENDEFMKAQQAEREYQVRMKEVLDNPTVEKLHPMRKGLMVVGNSARS